MFKLALAQYISDNMVRLDMTYKDLAHDSGIPLSTLHSYAQGKVNNPSDEYCARLAQTFGDSPDVIQQMRRDALYSTAQENKLIARADDKALLEEMSGLIRSNMLEVMDAYKAHALEQQDQIIRHADARVVQAEQRCADQLSAMRAHYEDKIAAEKSHAEQVLAKEHEHRKELRERNARTRDFLKACVFNISLALAVVSALLIATSVYAFYAYHTFDRSDPARGLYQPDLPANEALIAFGVFLVILIVALVGFVTFKNRRDIANWKKETAALHSGDGQ